MNEITEVKKTIVIRDFIRVSVKKYLDRDKEVSREIFISTPCHQAAPIPATFWPKIVEAVEKLNGEL